MKLFLIFGGICQVVIGVAVITGYEPSTFNQVITYFAAGVWLMTNN